jgi:hypothetical protein
MEAVFASSAFRHGYTKQDFYELLAADYLKIRSLRGLDEVYELLGRNLSGAYLHVVYRVLPDRRLRVFHMNGMTDAQKGAIGGIGNEEDKTKGSQPNQGSH